MFIDYYNLCRILYYSGFNNDKHDMTKNIVINYGGDRTFDKYKSDYWKYYEVIDYKTSGHASAISLFFRKYLYSRSGETLKYNVYDSNQRKGYFRHHHFKNEDIMKFTQMKPYLETVYLLKFKYIIYII